MFARFVYKPDLPPQELEVGNMINDPYFAGRVKPTSASNTIIKVCVAILFISFSILSLSVLGYIGIKLKLQNERKYMVSMLEGHPISPLKRIEIDVRFKHNTVTIDDAESIGYLRSLKYSTTGAKFHEKFNQYNGPNYACYFVYEDGTRARGGLMLISNVFPINTPENRDFLLSNA